MTRPRIGITAGDPAGIGPEIAARAIDDPRVTAVCEPVVYGPAPTAAAFPPGRPTAASGRAAVDAIERAVADALAGVIEAVATGPISKHALALAGLPWKGHTDLLAALTQAPRVAMMFHSEPLSVILLTDHVSIRDVPDALTAERVDVVLDLAAAALPRLGRPAPRLGLAGLNPHAGEHGLLGDEDRLVLAPAVERARQRGIDVTGPLPADTIFVRAVRGEFDAVVACYHDQGLIPVKLAAFGKAVNVTLGLPIVRTSPDHGTAFDIAGRGCANPSSMVEAIRLAAQLARRRNPWRGG
jgi:4-hydroxythreonine-4-phosphate dehydrogenase